MRKEGRLWELLTSLRQAKKNSGNAAKCGEKSKERVLLG